MQWKLRWSNGQEMCRCVSIQHLRRFSHRILRNQLFSRICNKHWQQHMSVWLCAWTLQKSEKQLMFKLMCGPSLCWWHFKKLCLSMYSKSFDILIDGKWKEVCWSLLSDAMAWHVCQKMCDWMLQQHFFFWIQPILLTVLSWTISLRFGFAVCH